MNGPSRLRRLWESHEPLRFLLVGVWNTLFGYLCFAGLFLLLRGRIHYLAVLVLAHIAAVTNAFIGHRRLTFRVRGHLLADYLRFNLAYLGALGLGLAGLPLLIEGVHLHPLLAQALLNAVVVATSYVMHKHVSFRRRQQPPP